MKQTGFLAACGAILLLAGPLRAQEAGLLIGLGSSLPVGAFDEEARSGPQFLAAFHIQGPGMPVGVRLDVQYSMNSLEVPGTFVPTLRTTTISLGAEYRVRQMTFVLFKASLTPYVHAGGMWGSPRCSGQSTACDGIKTESGFGFNTGVGLMQRRFFMETRYLGSPGATGLQFVAVTVGFHI